MYKLPIIHRGELQFALIKRIKFWVFDYKLKIIRANVIRPYA